MLSWAGRRRGPCARHGSHTPSKLEMNGTLCRSSSPPPQGGPCRNLVSDDMTSSVELHLMFVNVIGVFNRRPLDGYYSDYVDYFHSSLVFSCCHTSPRSLNCCPTAICQSEVANATSFTVVTIALAQWFTEPVQGAQLLNLGPIQWHFSRTHR